MRIRNLCLVLATAFSLSACVFHAGSPKHVNTTTVGQELTDLKLAWDNGAITDPEYRAMKAKILNNDRHQKHVIHENH